MPGVLTWVSVHRKLLAYIAGIALTAAVHTWGTANPYVALALLAATGLGIHQVPNELGTAPATAPQPVLSGPSAGTAGTAPSGT